MGTVYSYTKYPKITTIHTLEPVESAHFAGALKMGIHSKQYYKYLC